MAEPTAFSNLQTPEQIAANRKLGQTLMMQGMSAEPVQHWTQGLARVLQGGVGRMNVNSADDATKARQSALMDAIQRSPTFGGLSPEDRGMMGMDPDLLRGVAGHAFGQKLDPMAGLKRQQAELALRSGQQEFEQRGVMNPLAANAAREAQRHASVINPYEEAAKRKALEDPKSGVFKEGDIPWVTDSQGRRVLDTSINLPPNLSKIPEHVAKSAGFVSRMVGAEENVRRIMEQVAVRHAQKTKGFDPTSPQTAVTNAMPEALANLTVRDSEHQQYRQATEQWIRAFLRKESGAVIGPDEFKRDFIVYFPQPGNDAKTIAQKEAARHAVMQGFYHEGAPLLSKTNPRVAERLNRFAPTTEVPNPPAVNPGAPPPSEVKANRLYRPEDAAKLPKGTRFIGIDGIEREVR